MITTNNNVLLTGFKRTSSELLVGDTSFYNFLLFSNDKNKDSEMLINYIKNNDVKYIFSFGQKPNIKDKVYIETTAKIGEFCINTKTDCEQVKLNFEQSGIIAKISHNAGTSFCNKVYFNSLKYISENHLNIKMVFIHIPYKKNISDFDKFKDKIFNTIKIYENETILNDR